MIDIARLRQGKNSIITLGNHPGIIQSILDFDYLCGKAEPSIVAIITTAAKSQKFFWGGSEILLPCYVQLNDLPKNRARSINLFINLNSARRVQKSTEAFFEYFPKALGGHIFAEDVPEATALALYEKYQSKHFVVGASGVGLLIANQLKLGAIGGTDYRQMLKAHIFTPGNIAVLSASGGMTNEIIRMIANQARRVSFTLTFGGDRFPITPPTEAFLAAEADPATEQIVYYGELGGYDEYDIVELIETKKVTKPVVAYIAGSISEQFATPVQFGHAKALAGNVDESASAKRKAMKSVGVKVANSIEEFHTLIGKMNVAKIPDPKLKTAALAHRRKSLFSTTIGKESKDDYEFVGKSLTAWEKQGDFINMALAGLMGREPKSALLREFTNTIFILGLDHGPQVSGALNTIVTARAGKDMVSSLSAGLLAIGPRFGGAGNEAARNWFEGSTSKVAATEFVESLAKQKKLILGIGHKKYRLGYPDPRVSRLLELTKQLKTHRYLDFAQAVEKVTTSKKGNLILNFDGAFAAILLDILEQAEKLSEGEIKELIDTEFFNAFFVIPRSVGFISHFLDQKRLDEGLFRLPDDAVYEQ